MTISLTLLCVSNRIHSDTVPFPRIVPRIRTAYRAEKRLIGRVNRDPRSRWRQRVSFRPIRRLNSGIGLIGANAIGEKSGVVASKLQFELIAEARRIHRGWKPKIRIPSKAFTFLLSLCLFLSPLSLFFFFFFFFFLSQSINFSHRTCVPSL